MYHLGLPKLSTNYEYYDALLMTTACMELSQGHRRIQQTYNQRHPHFNYHIADAVLKIESTTEVG